MTKQKISGGWAVPSSSQLHLPSFLFFSRLPHLLYLKRSSYKILEYSSEECGGTMCKLGGYNTNQTDQGNWNLI